eukprot:SAG31_NODE_13459_length_867_cov_1.641927_1_plen_37_part_10
MAPAVDVMELYLSATILCLRSLKYVDQNHQAFLHGIW